MLHLFPSSYLSWYASYKQLYPFTITVCQRVGPPAFYCLFKTGITAFFTWNEFISPILDSCHCTPCYGLLVCYCFTQLLFFWGVGGWTLLRNGAFAQVLSKCMTVSRHKCVGGHVKNEWHFEWMHSVVHKFVSTQGNVLKCCSNLALQMFSFGIQQTLILTDSELPKHIRVIMHIAVGYTVLSSQMRHIFPCFSLLCWWKYLWCWQAERSEVSPVK